MDSLKSKVLKELIDQMDSRMGEKLKGKAPAKAVMIETVAEKNVSRPDKGWGAIIHKPGAHEDMMPDMAMNEESDLEEDKSEAKSDEERLKEMYKKLK